MTDRSSSPDTLFVRDSHHHRANPHHNGLALPSLHTRFPGDGLDYRRPVMSGGDAGSAGAGSSSNMAIDLTEDDGNEQENVRNTSAEAAREVGITRHGRTGLGGALYGDTYHDASTRTPGLSISSYLTRQREQRDREREHPRFSVLRHLTRQPSADMDDVEITNMRPRRRSPPAITRGSSPGAAPAQVTATAFPPGRAEPIDLTSDNEDDVVLVDTRTRQGDNLARPGATAGVGTRSVADQRSTINDLLNGGTRLLDRMQRYGHAFTGLGELPPPAARPNYGPNPNRVPRVAHFHPLVGQAQTVMMDYAMPGFDLGYAGANRPPTPKYEPPEKAAPGFTRSPGEDEEIVCPNCGDELAMGEEDIKQQVWVIKKCGHVSARSGMWEFDKIGTDRISGILRHLRAEPDEKRSKERKGQAKGGGYLLDVFRSPAITLQEVRCGRLRGTGWCVFDGSGISQLVQHAAEPTGPGRQQFGERSWRSGDIHWTALQRGFR